MPSTPERARRIEASLLRSMNLSSLIVALEYAVKCDRVHARTNRTDDYLALILARHAVTELLDEVLQTCLDADRERLADEAASECSYSIKEECYFSDSGDLLLGGEKPRDLGLADFIADRAREDRSAA